MKLVKKRGRYRVSERYKGTKEEDPVLVSLKFNSDVSKGVDKGSKTLGVRCSTRCYHNSQLN